MIRRIAGLAFATAVASYAPRAAADPIEFVEQRDQYMIFQDVSGELDDANWFMRDPFLAAFGDVEDGYLAAHADDSQFLIVYTTWSLPPPVGALYQSVANDVQGIGFEHIAPLDAVVPEPYFDDTPDSQLQGFMHMNNWMNYLGDDAGGVDDSRISLVFGQELGHAWLAFVHWMDGNGTRSDMLGRAEAHWSFYMDAGPSPVEGHDWVDNGDGTFTAVKHDIFTFSELDLYLMGLAPAAAVAPWFILENVTNCIDSALKDGSCAPPTGHTFAADSYTVTATRREITIEDVIASEGPRVPAFGDAPTEFDASFVLITRPGERLSEEDKLQIDTIIERSIDIWAQQTAGAGLVVNRTAAEDPSGGEDTDGGPGGADETGASDGGGGDDSPGGDAGTAGTGGSENSTGATEGGAASGDSDDGGCSCTTSSRGGTWALLGTVVFGLRRRRRPTRARR